jgi:hypothetical protein
MEVWDKIRRRVDNMLAPAVRHGHSTHGITVWECNAWRGYMIEVMYPDATRVRVRPGARAEHLLRTLPADTRAVVLHIDASVTTDVLVDDAGLRAALAARGVAAVNVGATDIRKATIHARCAELGVTSARASHDGPADERVIIKTTLNAGGAPERKLARWAGRPAESLTADVSDLIRGPFDYRICRRAEVPPAVWADPRLVVERFVDNPAGAFFRVYVVGPAGVVSEARADRDIKKLSMPIRAPFLSCAAWRRASTCSSAEPIASWIHRGS